MRRLKVILNLLFLFGAALLLVECANPVSPVGGPQDVTPPKVENAEPPLYSRNFKATRARVWFDEFVAFKDLNQQVIISPPMDEKPEFKIKGKSIVIEFKEELKDSTTYNIFFGNAIVDITEGNPVSNFQYVFSTGNVLDSLSFRGQVKDAFTMEPVKDLNVMLYLNNNDTLPFDSLPYFVKPYYLSKTTESGDFQFNNLLNRNFKLFVLEDANANMLFDQASERIAFIDSLITPYYLPPPAIPDSLNDTLVEQVDTTIVFKEPDPLALYLFQEKDSVQRFIKASLVKQGKLMFIFKEPTIAPEITALELPDRDSWKITEYNATRDTVSIWVRESVPDTLTFRISDNGLVLDTVEMSLLEKAKNRREKAKDEAPPTEKLIVKFGKKTELNTTQKVTFNYPLKEADLAGAFLVENSDTLVPSFQIADSLGLRGEFIHQWKENASYSFLIPDSSFIGIGGQSHDTLRHNLKTKAIADYGNLYVNVTFEEPGINHIFLLMKKDKILAQRIINSDTKLSFEYLLPDDYVIKVIVDRNNNKAWDTGHYILNIQPEPVSFYPQVITIRANWDVVEDWSL